MTRRFAIWMLVVVMAPTLAGCASSSTPSVGSATPIASGATASMSSAAVPSPSVVTAASRIDVPGGPLGFDVADGHAWVVATDGGQLVDVDLETGSSVPMDIGPSANWVKVLDPNRLVLSRYAPAPGRATLEIIDVPDGAVTSIADEPIDGLDVDDAGIWAFAKSGTVIVADTDGRIVGQALVQVAENEHMDLVGTGEAAFASSDSTPIRRVDRDPTAVSESITTDGGVPFVADGGLVWGARPDVLWAIDPATNAVTRRYPLSDVSEILDLDVEGDDIWIGVRHPGRSGAVIRLDLATGEEVADIPVDLPAAVVIDDDRTWVTDYEAGVLLGFDR